MAISKCKCGSDPVTLLIYKPHDITGYHAIKCMKCGATTKDYVSLFGAMKEWEDKVAVKS